MLQAQPETQQIMETNGGSMDKTVFGDLNNDVQDDCLMLIDKHLVWYTIDTNGYWSERYVIEQQITKTLIQLYIEDFDGDGRKDIGYIYSTYPTYTFGWYRNMGTEDMLWPENTSGISEMGLAGFMDVDTDGDADMISITTTNDLGLHINDAGSFSAPTTLATDVFYFRSGDKNDIDQDGLDDLIVSTTDAVLRYLHNNGDGTIAVQTIDAESIYKVRLGDITGDGYADIVYHYGDIYYHPYLPDVDQFGSAIAIGEMPILTFYCKDFEDDGDADLIYVDEAADDDQRVRVIFNTGFDAPAEAVTVLDNLLNSAIVVIGDINADNRLDVLEGLKKKVDAYLQLEDGTFTDNYEPDTTHNRIVFSTWTDINGDGTPDLLQCNEEGVLGWLEYDPATNTILSAHPFPKNEASPSPVGMLADDIDNDGDVDVVAGFRIAPGFEHWSYYYLNDGSGHFSMKLFTAAACTQMALLDGNEDGDKDLLALTTAGYLYILENTGDTASLFAPGIIISLSGTNSFELTDLDNDGLLDIAAARNYDDVQKIVNATGPAYFLPSADCFDVPCSGTNSVYCDDYDGDGDTDILYSCTDGQAYIAQNNAGAYTQLSIGTMKGSRYSDACINQLADINNDGKKDLICSDRDYGMYIKYSSADGYKSDHDYLPGVFGHFVSMDGDSWPDLLAADDFKWYVTYDAALNSGNTELSAPTLTWLAENGPSDSIILTLGQIPANPLILTVIPHLWLNTGAGTGVTQTITIPADSTALQPLVIKIANTHADSIPEQIMTGTVQFIFDPDTWGIAAASLDTTITYTLTDDDPKVFIISDVMTLIETTTYSNVYVNLNVYQNTDSWMYIDPDDHVSTIAGEGITYSMLIPSGLGSIATYYVKLRNMSDYLDEPDMTEWVHFDVSSDVPSIDTMESDPLQVHLIDDDVSSLQYVLPTAYTYIEGDAFVVKFKLLTAPLYDLDIIAQPDEQLDLGEGPGQPYTFHFTGGDYNGGYKSKTGFIVLDEIAEGLHEGTITYTIVTDDTIYGAMTIPTTTINIEDGWLGINSEEESGLQITPTAGDGHLTISAGDTPGLKQVTIFALNGAAVFTSNSAADQIQLDLSHLPAGSYWAVVRINEGAKSGRFSITH